MVFYSVSVALAVVVCLRSLFYQPRQLAGHLGAKILTVIIFKPQILTFMYFHIFKKRKNQKVAILSHQQRNLFTSFYWVQRHLKQLTPVRKIKKFILWVKILKEQCQLEDVFISSLIKLFKTCPPRLSLIFNLQYKFQIILHYIEQVNPIQLKQNTRFLNISLHSV